MAETVTSEEILAARTLLARREFTQKELSSAPREFGNGIIDRDEYSRRTVPDSQRQLPSEPKSVRQSEATGPRIERHRRPP